MAMRTLTKRENQILSACVVLLAVYVGYNFVYKSFQEKFDTFEERVEAQKLRLIKNQKLLSKQEILDAQYEQLAQRLRQERSDEQEMTLILSEIESVANQIGMRVTDMKPQRVRKVDFYNQFTINLTTDGQLPAILNFIYLLETKPHHFDILEMRLERSSSGSNQLRSLLTLSRILVPKAQ